MRINKPDIYWERGRLARNQGEARKKSPSKAFHRFTRLRRGAGEAPALPALRIAIRPTWMLAILAFAMLLMIACEPKPSPAAKRYNLRGKVVSVEKNRHIVTVAHEEVKDFMPPMTMPFNVRDDWSLEVVAPGDVIAAALVVDGTESWLEEVVITKGEPDSSSSTTVPTEPKPGDEVPNFRLVNQDGKFVRLHDYRGKALLLTFIFTRCPQPDQCTLMSNNFAAVDFRLQQQPALYERTHLLSVSFDPKYDTPRVLRSYGAAYTGKYSDETFSHWEFATGSDEEIKSITKYFGLSYTEDKQAGKEEIIHSLRTAIIGPDGKLFKFYRGNDWKPEEVLKELQTALNGNENLNVNRP